MDLRLDGGFWGRWIREVYVSEVEWMRRSVFDYILPSFPDPGIDADKVMDAAWETAMPQPSDGSDDPASFAEWAEEKVLESYLGITKIRQAAPISPLPCYGTCWNNKCFFFLCSKSSQSTRNRRSKKSPRPGIIFLDWMSFIDDSMRADVQ